MHFSDATTAWGILAPTDLNLGQGAGVAAADYDGDGDIDLYVPNGNIGPGHLYRNDDGVFSEVGEASGIDVLQQSRAALWFDYDGDGDLDLLIASDDFMLFTGLDTSFRLYRQDGGGQFTDVTVEAGLFLEDETGSHRGGLSAGDIDNDGDLDVLATLWSGKLRLFQNEGDGTFLDVSEPAGLGVPPLFTWQGIFHDFDGDGWQDIYIMVDFSENLLLINQGDGTFVDIAALAAADVEMNCMGVALGDFDSDDDFDIYITNIYAEIQELHNVLLEDITTSTGPLLYADVGYDFAVDDCSWAWGATFFDADLDGAVDLAVTNGYESPPYDTDVSRFFLNRLADGLGFVEVGEAIGFADELWGSSLIACDLDRDGDLELVQTAIPREAGTPSLRVLEALTLPDRHYLVVQPRMPDPNGHAIGAVVRIEAPGLTASRLITAGTSFLGQEPAEAHFGLGGRTEVDSLTVHFPDGSMTTLNDVAADQVIVVEPPRFVRGDVNADGLVDIADGVYLLQALFLGGAPAPCADSCDIDDNSILDAADALSIFAYSLLGGPPPPAPFPDCGEDPTSFDGVPCSTVESCPAL